MSEGKRLLAWGLGAFACATAVLLLLGARLAPGASKEPGFAPEPVAQAQADGWRRVTLDVADAQRWTGFSFELGREVPLGPAADLSACRFQLKAPGGARRLPDGAWTADAAQAGDPSNPVLSRWYAYSYWTHRLEPRGDEYAVRLAVGQGTARVKVVSYYCAQGEPGCLTLLYRLEGEATDTQRGNG